MHTMRLPKLCDSDRACIYGVEVYASEAGVTVVLSEVPANKGAASITKAIEHVATDIVRGLLDRDVVMHPDMVQWIEHYPPTSELGYAAPGHDVDWETFDRVEMTWCERDMRYKSPLWKPFGDRRTPPVFGESERVI